MRKPCGGLRHRQEARLSELLVYFDALGLWIAKAFAMQCQTRQCNAIQGNAILGMATQDNAMHSMQFTFVHCNSIQCNEMQFSTTQFSTLQGKARQRNACEFKTMQFSTMHCKTALSWQGSAMQRIQRDPYTLKNWVHSRSSGFMPALCY